MEAGEVAPADGLDFAISDCGVNRKTRGRSAVAGAEELPRVEDRVWGLELLPAGGSTRLVDAVSFRRIARRSDSDPRDTLLDSEMLGEDARGSTLGLSADDGDRAMLSVPIQLPIFGLEASDGCGNVFLENRLERSRPLLDPKLRALGALGVMLGAGVWLTGGLGGPPNAEFCVWEPSEGRDGAVENDLPASKEGPEGREGADLGWVNEGLGWLKDGLGRLNEGLG